MGWNSWNTLGTGVTQEQVVQTIDFMAANGLVQAGYDTVTIDDGWSENHRDGQTTDLVKNSYGAMQLYDAGGNPVSGTDGTGIDPTSGHLIPHPGRFPSRTVNGQPVNGIQYLSWYAHSKGMKFGLYATDTYTTCQGHPGSLGHESTDAADFVAWGWTSSSTTTAPTARRSPARTATTTGRRARAGADPVHLRPGPRLPAGARRGLRRPGPAAGGGQRLRPAGAHRPPVPAGRGRPGPHRPGGGRGRQPAVRGARLRTHRRLVRPGGQPLPDRRRPRPRPRRSALQRAVAHGPAVPRQRPARQLERHGHDVRRLAGPVRPLGHHRHLPLPQADDAHRVAQRDVRAGDGRLPAHLGRRLPHPENSRHTQDGYTWSTGITPSSWPSTRTPTSSPSTRTAWPGPPRWSVPRPRTARPRSCSSARSRTATPPSCWSTRTRPPPGPSRPRWPTSG
ncbi:hypothetical protein ACFQ0M_44340 [Kitasatospora aburaviensis]